MSGRVPGRAHSPTGTVFPSPGFEYVGLDIETGSQRRSRARRSPVLLVGDRFGNGSTSAGDLRAKALSTTPSSGCNRRRSTMHGFWVEGRHGRGCKSPRQTATPQLLATRRRIAGASSAPILGRPSAPTSVPRARRELPREKPPTRGVQDRSLGRTGQRRSRWSALEIDENLRADASERSVSFSSPASMPSWRRGQWHRLGLVGSQQSLEGSTPRDPHSPSRQPGDRPPNDQEPAPDTSAVRKVNLRSRQAVAWRRSGLALGTVGSATNCAGVESADSGAASSPPLRGPQRPSPGWQPVGSSAVLRYAPVTRERPDPKARLQHPTRSVSRLYPQVTRS